MFELGSEAVTLAHLQKNTSASLPRAAQKRTSLIDNNKVFCLCLPGVGFANLLGSVAGDLEVSGLE
jgi:hypothetical protein